jgi:hypothetical protein
MAIGTAKRQRLDSLRATSKHYLQEAVLTNIEGNNVLL